MVQRVTVTVSDELHERLQKVKNEFNISGVCQAAIEREVNRQELLLQENGTMETTIERLRQEKESHDEQYKDMGFEAGRKDAKNMPYNDLVDLSGNDCYNTDTWQNCMDKLKSEWKDLENESPGIDWNAYTEGWRQGVVAFFEEVKDQL